MSNQPVPDTGRVLHLLGPSTGGIRRHVVSLARELPEFGWSVSVAGPPGVMGEAVQHYDVPISFAPHRVLQSMWRLRRACRAFEPDVLHAHGLKAGWIASLVSRRAPVVLTLHNRVLEVTTPTGRILARLERWLPRRVAAVIAVSDELTTGIRARHLSVIPAVGPAPQPDASRDDVRSRHLTNASQEHLVVTIARLHPQKDLRTLLAAARLISDVEAIKWIVVGDGPEREDLERLRAELGLVDVVDFVGTRLNPANELAAADVVVVTSMWEGSPLVVTEALWLGAPLVSTAVGTVPELVTDGVTGRLVPVGDARALADAVLDLLRDRSSAHELGARARKIVRERLDPTTLTRRVHEVYEIVL